ncbi:MULTISPECIES: ATP-binding cassette domain-containing protein [Thermomonospora]|uniref:UvrABC system protein A n=1 Tax=Thermomonospora curvata (strain ATCC 19995 / DSM 43183 / JCM 3096 / KCTC 9072 / NBRC 15933 / NCIMB 10081 / Henssen B9) TaxID=471852 RepID=D1A612_THECD|nr:MULTISPECIES: excinuclease ABC subunit UvrA [Thermomonospora]ACY98307.1 ABC transporter related protein [Thermomonospora curvata DSM 43183]PKK13474.1 MAG: excinuclease ABC subunit UvrA [Thermomonospora sp. CIF 1]
MEVDHIEIVGAREHNLKDVSLRIPKNKITVFTGVSGSGKSSLVFDTLAVEAQRQLNGTFSWFVRNQLPKYQRPHVDTIEGLTAPVIVDQKPVGGNARSTVGTMTDIYSMLRVLFSRHGKPENPPHVFSFNNPEGMCPECEGLGQVRRVDVDAMLDKSKSLEEGAIRLPTHKVGSMDWQLYAASGYFDVSKKLRDYTEEEWHMLCHGTGGKVTVRTKNTTYDMKYEGVVDRFARNNLKRDLSGLSERGRANIERFITLGECTSCRGRRLNPTALATEINGRNIADWTAMEVSDLIAVLAEIDDPAVASIVEGIRTSLERIEAIGLGYLTLDRATLSLSGGEAQRLKTVRHLSSSLVGMTYVFDEPSTGLHPRDVGRLNELLRALRDKGNTVLVVEHDPDVIAIADHVVDIGPKAGVHGGRIVFEGPFEKLREADTLTGAGLRRTGVLKSDFREPAGRLPIIEADLHNLKSISVDFPTGVLTVVTGVAGSGKSSLVSQVFMQTYPEAIFVDQSPIKASARSTPVSFLEAMDPIRKLFAKANKTDAALFSFNSAGACQECKGRGELITELAYMDPVRTRCESCEGRRFNAEVLAHRLRGKSIADVLEMSAEEAVEFFTEREVRDRLRGLLEVGLGYLSIGQSLSTLSGGERQRLKLAARLGGSGDIYVLDEPTTGLHMSDVEAIVDLLDRLVDAGNTVIVIEHNLDVVRRADWVIDLGPEGGKHGGQVVFTGTPRQLLECPDSATGDHLRRYLAA